MKQRRYLVIRWRLRFHPDHSARENRYLTVGMSQSGRILIVSHTDRGENIRISARKTTRSERKFYEEGK
jgi:uncharacterized DUF497 family protein